VGEREREEERRGEEAGDGEIGEIRG